MTAASASDGEVRVETRGRALLIEVDRRANRTPSRRRCLIACATR
jgi:hypothetical protein